MKAVGEAIRTRKWFPGRFLQGYMTRSQLLARYLLLAYAILLLDLTLVQLDRTCSWPCLGDTLPIQVLCSQMVHRMICWFEEYIVIQKYIEKDLCCVHTKRSSKFS
jgi:hypothetical protein